MRALYLVMCGMLSACPALRPESPAVCEWMPSPARPRLLVDVPDEGCPVAFEVCLGLTAVAELRR